MKLLIVAQPTRGLDVGSMEFVHRRIVAERDRGAAVVLVSTELDEVLGLADRIGVMYRGKIAGEVAGGASAEEIGLLMAGSHEQPRRCSSDRTSVTEPTPEPPRSARLRWVGRSRPSGRAAPS